MSGPRVLFFGTPVFAAEVLEYLIDTGVDVVAVVSKPDKPQGRGRVIVPTPVKAVALARGLPLFQPEKASAPEHVALLEGFAADLFVVVAYGEIIREHLLAMPPLGCINVHASLLPKYRGAAPIQRCLIDGVAKTGVTIMHMVRQMDTGDVIATATVAVDMEMNYGELSEALCLAAKEPLRRTIDQLAAGTAPRYPQDHAAATYAPKIELEECCVDWKQPAQQVHNLIRGVFPEPGAWCYVTIRGQQKRLRLLRSRLRHDFQGAPGAIVSEGDSLVVACGEGALEILDLQLEGKRPMKAAELRRGSELSFDG